MPAARRWQWDCGEREVASIRMKTTHRNETHRHTSTQAHRTTAHSIDLQIQGETGWRWIVNATANWCSLISVQESSQSLQKHTMQWLHIAKHAVYIFVSTTHMTPSIRDSKQNEIDLKYSPGRPARKKKLNTMSCGRGDDGKEICVRSEKQCAARKMIKTSYVFHYF